MSLEAVRTVPPGAIDPQVGKVGVMVGVRVEVLVNVRVGVRVLVGEGV